MTKAWFCSHHIVYYESAGGTQHISPHSGSQAEGGTTIFITQLPKVPCSHHWSPQNGRWARGGSTLTALNLCLGSSDTTFAWISIGEKHIMWPHSEKLTGKYSLWWGSSTSYFAKENRFSSFWPTFGQLHSLPSLTSLQQQLDVCLWKQ